MKANKKGGFDESPPQFIFHIFKIFNLAKNLKTVLTFYSSASICTVTAHICNKLISLFHYILSHPLIPTVKSFFIYHPVKKYDLIKPTYTTKKKFYCKEVYCKEVFLKKYNLL